MKLIQFLFRLILTVSLVSCTAYEYPADKNITAPSIQPIYSGDGYRSIKRERRMEHIRARGCAEHSTDCGGTFGW